MLRWTNAVQICRSWRKDPTQKNVMGKKPLSIIISVLPGWKQEHNIHHEYLGSLCRRPVHFSAQLSSEQADESVFRIFSVVGVSSKPGTKGSLGSCSDSFRVWLMLDL